MVKVNAEKRIKIKKKYHKDRERHHDSFFLSLLLAVNNIKQPKKISVLKTVFLLYICFNVFFDN